MRARQFRSNTAQLERRASNSSLTPAKLSVVSTPRYGPVLPPVQSGGLHIPSDTICVRECPGEVLWQVALFDPEKESAERPRAGAGRWMAEADENPERIAGEIRRQILRFYGVRDVELSNVAAMEESGAG